MAYRVTNQLEEEATAAAASATVVSGDESTHAQGQIARTAGSESRKMDEEEEKDSVFFRLEGLGYRVGQGLVERFVAFFCFLSLGGRTPTLSGWFMCGLEWGGLSIC